MINKLQLALLFLSGAVVGAVVILGINTLTSRSGGIGGEVLIPLLVVLVAYAGWSVRDFGAEKEVNESYHKGFRAGVESVLGKKSNCRHEIIPYYKKEV